MNKVMLIGRLTKDPEMRYANNNTVSICSFTLAVNRRKQGEADFIMCKAFNKTAEFCNSYFQKGQQVAIEGRINTGSYEKDGQKIYTTDVVIEQAYFADSKRGSVSDANDAVYTVENNEELPF